MKYVVFDFNGTILDDVDVCLRALNQCIEHFGIKRNPLDRDEYLHVFDFPVKSYYEKVGFDWKGYSFEEVSAYWFDLYCSLKDEYKVHDGVIEILKKNREKGYQNIILSASSLNEMKKQLRDLKIEEYFDEVLGIDNIYAASKIDIGLEWMKDKNPLECILIGDSLHDMEVARKMNIDCILVAKGHQAKDVLQNKYDKVVDDIRQVEL
ncbi:MAG: HAD hydrolase-like protein [Erysipelotrichaceae bacterium]|nr:HAD hydrolase-like protein [Erysipelotrichaceae bacterium]